MVSICWSKSIFFAWGLRGASGNRNSNHKRREESLDTIVAVRGKEGEEIIPPCGNFRQILRDYMPECGVIVSVHGELKKIRAKELLPLSYSVE